MRLVSPEVLLVWHSVTRAYHASHVQLAAKFALEGSPSDELLTAASVERFLTPPEARHPLDVAQQLALACGRH